MTPLFRYLCNLHLIGFLYLTGPTNLALGQVIEPSPSDTTELVPADSIALDVPPDEAILQRMQAVFSNIEAFNEVEVTVNEGVATITGTVPDTEARQKIEDLANRFEGVIYVENQVGEASDVETRVSPTIERLREYWDQIVANLPVFAIALLVLLFFSAIARALKRWEAPFRRFGISPLAGSLLRRSLGTVLFTIGLVLALDILDVTALIGAVLGAAGVVGLALGFAFQDIVENYLAGVLLSIRQPFNVNDFVGVGEHQGKVVRMTSRELIMLTLDGNHLRLPNATVFKSPVINYTRNPLRRFTFTVGVANGLDLALVMETGRETLENLNGIIAEPAPSVHIEELGDSNVVLQFFAWIDQRETDFFKIKSEALRLVKAAFDAADYEMPEPTYRINLIQKVDPSPRSQKQHVPPGTPAPKVRAEARAIDVAPGGAIDRQVYNDLAGSDEENLLDR